MLIMSATPIPRTLAMILYGDLDISIIDELPPGRKPVKTYACGGDMHSRVYNFLYKNIKKNTEYLQNYLLDGLKQSGKRPCDVDRYLGTNGMAGHYFGKSQWEFPTKEVYEKLQNFLYLPV